MVGPRGRIYSGNSPRLNEKGPADERAQITSIFEQGIASVTRASSAPMCRLIVSGPLSQTATKAARAARFYYVTPPSISKTAPNVVRPKTVVSGLDHAVVTTVQIRGSSCQYFSLA